MLGFIFYYFTERGSQRQAMRQSLLFSHVDFPLEKKQNRFDVQGRSATSIA
jgi:hypothetical protein